MPHPAKVTQEPSLGCEYGAKLVNVHMKQWRGVIAERKNNCLAKVAHQKVISSYSNDITQLGERK